MSRNLDSPLSAALSDSNISPVILASLTFQSGVVYVWSGVGDLVFEGNTYKGVGSLGNISAITEGSDVQADGMTVSLSGIGLSPFQYNQTIPPNATVPVTPEPGQFVAWAFPQGADVFDKVAADVNALGGEGTGADSWCSIGYTTGTIGGGGARCTFSGWSLPTLPSDAVIQALYVNASKYSQMMDVSFDFPPPNVSIGNTLDTARNYSLTGSAFATSFDVGASATLAMGPMAIYYTSTSNTASFVNEAMDDYSLGAPAKVWFGLLNNGELVGNPYLVFSGQVDQPTIDISTNTATVSIALENKLSNLLRPTARRYTAADQHLLYPDDIGFNWVEVLNDLAIRWGS